MCAKQEVLDQLQLPSRRLPSTVDSCPVPSANYDSFSQKVAYVQTFRMNGGAGAGTLQTPLRVTDYIPPTDDVGGFFDNHARAATARAKRA
jgi:hypothetical protein